MCNLLCHRKGQPQCYQYSNRLSLQVLHQVLQNEDPHHNMQLPLVEEVGGHPIQSWEQIQFHPDTGHHFRKYLDQSHLPLEEVQIYIDSLLHIWKEVDTEFEW